MCGHRMLQAAALLVGVVALVMNGCGLLSVERTLFPNQVVDADGRPLHIEDIQEITQDPDLTRDEMIEALRELGIESDELIQAIIDDGLGS